MESLGFNQGSNNHGGSWRADLSMQRFLAVAESLHLLPLEQSGVLGGIRTVCLLIFPLILCMVSLDHTRSGRCFARLKAIHERHITKNFSFSNVLPTIQLEANKTMGQRHKKSMAGRPSPLSSFEASYNRDGWLAIRVHIHGPRPAYSTCLGSACLSACLEIGGSQHRLIRTTPSLPTVRFGYENSL